MSSRAPSLTVVLAAPKSLRRIAKTLDSLVAQTARDRLEIVIVTDATEATAVLEPSLAEFASYTVVHVEKLGSRAAANAEGFRHASADIVAFGEDHCFPATTWAAALIERHGEGWAAVGPAIENANPASAVSRCDLLVNYGPWVAADSGEVSHLPGHNTSYKRASLASRADRLTDLLEVEVELHEEMAAAGERLCFEPAARVAHVNISRWRPWLACSFYAGRVYAAARARRWSLGRRALYVSAWPLIALVRLSRTLLDWPAAAGSAARLAPVLAAGLISDAAGQAFGYATGMGQARERMASFELDRIDHVRPSERALLEIEEIGGAAR